MSGIKTLPMLRFNSGINIIVGENGVGKTSLIKHIAT